MLGQLSKWFSLSTFDQGTRFAWLMGLVLLLCIGFLWSTVVRQVVE